MWIRIVAFFSNIWADKTAVCAKEPLRSLGDLIRYLYFLRFSILLWLLPLLLCALNETGARTLMSGIVTPVRWVQYLCVSFFLVASGFQALILARIVLLHGEQRFNHRPPLWLARFFAAEEKQCRWLPRHRWFVESLAPVASQLSNACMFAYFFINGGKESVSSPQIALGLAVGILLALFFWYAVCGFYYLTYEPPVDRSSDGVLLPAGAATLVLPRWMFWLSDDEQGDGRGDVLERANVPKSNRIARFLAWIFPISGYKKKANEPLFEAHYFASVAVAGFVGLYLALCPLTAPMPMPLLSTLSILFYAAGGVALALVTILAQPATTADGRRLRWWKIWLGVLMLIFSASIPTLYFIDDGERFPILALVLILVMSLSWLLGALAFFLDRFRVPVLTAVILSIVAPRLMHLDGGMEEHHLSIALRNEPVPLSTPAKILSGKFQPGQPLIIVTSTGGGIHAATWTAAVLEQLEKKFSETDPGQTPLKSFHDHVLLLSTVSGGSIGLYTYLRELDQKTNGGNPQWDRMKIEAECPSLEAVGWGLVYYDIPKALVPVVPYFVPPSSGINDLTRWPLGKDRTWTLRRAFARNLHDAYCNSVYEQNPDDRDKFRLIGYSEVNTAHKQNANNESELTVGNLNPLDTSMPLPAFTMNTTTVEGGYRFLSANYQVPAHPLDPLNAEPAESFLQVYGGTQFADPSAKQGDPKQFTDIPLATAAQLSATFPLVSSAATFPDVRHKKGVHFVDGGYYDNDGTASAIEFIRASLDCWEKQPSDLNAQTPAYCAQVDAQLKSSGPLRIILVEIRNSPDLTATQICCLAWQDIASGKTPWNLFNQLVAPLSAFWGAGHDSVTDRNRNALQLLEGAYKDRLVLQHFVIDDRATAPSSDPTDKPLTDPLNWSLTPAQQFEVTSTATNDDNRAKYAKIKSCFLDSKNCDPNLPMLSMAHDACKKQHP